MKHHFVRSALAFFLVIFVISSALVTPSYAKPPVSESIVGSDNSNVKVPVTETTPPDDYEEDSPPATSPYDSSDVTTNMNDYSDRVFHIYKVIRSLALVFIGASIAKAGFNILPNLLTGKKGEELNGVLKNIFTMVCALFAFLMIPSMMISMRNEVQSHAWKPREPEGWYETKPPGDSYFGDEDYAYGGDSSANGGTGGDSLSNPSKVKKSLDMAYGAYEEDYNHEGWVFVPNNATERMPLIVFLHGSGEIGAKGFMKTNGLIKTVDKVYNINYPFILYQPVLSSGSWSSAINYKALKADIDSVASKFKVDKRKIIITGFSLGSYGTWKMISEYGDYFSAAIPISGHNIGPDGSKQFEMNYRNACEVPVRAYVGSGDLEWYQKGMANLVDSINYHGGDADFTTISGLKHETENALNSVFIKACFEWAITQ